MHETWHKCELRGDRLGQARFYSTSTWAPTRFGHICLTPFNVGLGQCWPSPTDIAPNPAEIVRGSKH